MPEQSYKKKLSFADAMKVVRYANENAYGIDKVLFSACYSRSKNRKFMYDYQFCERDIQEILADLDIGQYSTTSYEPHRQPAHEFGISGIVDDIVIYLKFQIIDAVIVISFHEAEREMDFPYRKE